MEQEQDKDDKRPKRVLDTKKFEEGCKRQSIEEKCRLVLAWCTKIIDVWEKDIQGGRPDNYMQTPEGKIEMGTFQQCQR